VAFTELDLLNRSRGYSLYLPDTREKCQQYWRLGYGIELQVDGVDAEGKEGYRMMRVTVVEKGEERIVPEQLLYR
jgi:CTP:phosphocholine cytidylyltransferase-like protein